MLQTGEVDAEEVILIIKCKLGGDLFGSGFRGSKWYESDRTAVSKACIYILKILLASDAFALSADSGNCRLQK